MWRWISFLVVQSSILFLLEYSTLPTIRLFIDGLELGEYAVCH
jgi:hypothetical protein